MTAKEAHIKKYSALVMAGRKKKKEQSEVYITGTWIFTNNAARIVNEKIAEMEAKGVLKYGKELAIQNLLNDAYKLKHSI